MRAKEFTINVPITISINGDEDPVVSAGQEPASQQDLQNNPVMVTPQQQELELAKAEQGKESPVIDKITAPDNIGSEDNNNLLDRIKQLISR